MADQTMAANKLSEKVVLDGREDELNDYLDIYTIKDSTDIIAASVVTTEGETSPDVDLCAGGEAPAGILLGYANEADKKASYSLGVTIGYTKLAKVLRRTGGRVRVQVIINRSATACAALVKGDPLYCSVTNAGQVSGVKPTTANIEALRFLGYVDEAVAATVTANKVITMRY